MGTSLLWNLHMNVSFGLCVIKAMVLLEISTVLCVRLFGSFCVRPDTFYGVFDDTFDGAHATDIHLGTPSC